MASVTMTSSFLGGACLADRSPAAAARRSLVVVNSARTGAEGEKVKLNYDAKKEGNNGRRELVFAAAAAAVSSVAGIAMADGPKPGTPEAKKAYAPICVTMPTAKICHK